MAESSVDRAATRLRDKLTAAKDGRYLTAVAGYLDRTDIEILVDSVLGPVPVPEPEPAPDHVHKFPLSTGVCECGEHHPTIGPVRNSYDLNTNTFLTGTGQRVSGIHSPAACAGRGCAVHHPSDHHMRDWPTNFRTGGMFDIKPPHMERMCEHGIGHPDPDDEAHFESVAPGQDMISTHGCDGCCRPPQGGTA